MVSRILDFWLGGFVIRSLFFTPDKSIRKNIPSAEFTKLIREQRGFLWIDFENEPVETSLPILQSFKFHPLAIDDALQESHVPKLDDWGDYLYIVLNYLDIKENGNTWETKTEELDIFLGTNYIITLHDSPLPA